MQEPPPRSQSRRFSPRAPAGVAGAAGAGAAGYPQGSSAAPRSAGEQTGGRGSIAVPWAGGDRCCWRLAAVNHLAGTSLVHPASAGAQRTQWLSSAGGAVLELTSALRARAELRFPAERRESLAFPADPGVSHSQGQTCFLSKAGLGLLPLLHTAEIPTNLYLGAPTHT